MSDLYATQQRAAVGYLLAAAQQRDPRDFVFSCPGYPKRGPDIELIKDFVIQKSVECAKLVWL